MFNFVCIYCPCWTFFIIPFFTCSKNSFINICLLSKNIEPEFGLSIKAYVIPEFTSNIFGTNSEITKEITPSRVTFTQESNATDEQVGK